ncbi:MAG: hypothetical protein HYR56_19460 [Acidobacteria bacterium]|nr:hypothetical protein [Acidobacteriota bacterium]MBI3424172.1 hypothetical protein [Acidobacteriota bacterium]
MKITQLLISLCAAGLCVAGFVASPVSAQNITAVERPEGIKKQMAARGEQDQAAPTLKIVAPTAGEKLTGNTVTLKLDLSGDLKGYHPHKDPATGTGNHIHVILDNNAYEAYYDIATPFEIKNLTPGQHTIRVFASRPWHESYKNAGAFQMVSFTVPSAQPGPPPPPAPKLSPKQPLLTYSRPKGEYKDAAADVIMLDFWLANAKLKGDGGKYRVRYTVDNGAPQFADKWEPVWLKGWMAGKHTIQLELVNTAGKVVENGGYNVTTREITVVK